MRALALLLSIVALPVLAQEEMGLDLSEEEVSEEFRPQLAVIGVTSVEGSDELQKSRAGLLEAELGRQTTNNTKFGRVLTPAQVAEALGPDAAAARQCAEYACLSALADKLGVQRVIAATVARSGTTSVLSVFAIDPTQPTVITATAESGERQEKQMIGGFTGLTGKSQAQKDKDFVKKATPAFYETLSKLATPLAKIIVDCFEGAAETTLNGKPIGKGGFSTLVPIGEYKLATNAEGYLPFEVQLKLEPKKVENVRVTLVARPLERKAVAVAPVEQKVPFTQRPGLYLAAGGVVAIAIAVGLGASTLGVNETDTDGDGVLDVTRGQVVAARNSAVAANVLYAVGAAAVGGGALWFFLTPTVKKGGGTQQYRGPDEPEQPGAGGGLGVVIGAGGTF